MCVIFLDTEPFQIFHVVVRWVSVFVVDCVLVRPFGEFECHGNELMHEIIFLVDLDGDIAIYTWRGFRDNAKDVAHSSERRHTRRTFDHGLILVLK